MNREDWLTAAARELESLWPISVPKYRVSVGWPGGRGKKDSVIGQAWKKEASEDNVAEIFISPKLSDPVEVLSVLVHELCHVIDGGESGHRGRFIDLAQSAGLTGKWTATVAGDGLKKRLVEISDGLGKYPHGALNPLESGVVKQPTRMLKLVCPGCGYIVRTSKKWVDRGLPTCYCGIELELEDC